MKPPTPVRDPGWIAGQVLLAATLVVAFPAASLLRSLNEHTPRLGESPFGSILLWGAVALLALHLVGRRRGEDHFPAPDDRRGMTVAMLLPVIVVLLGEKWVSAELLARAYGWIPAFASSPAQADAAYRLWTGLALLGFSLAAIWVLRQIAHRLRGMLMPEKLLPALWLLIASAAVPGALALALHAALPATRLAAAHPWSGTLLLAAAAQLVRGAAEELYFRGMLQTAAGRLLAQTPLGDGRVARLGAIGVVSLGFAIEHVNPAVGAVPMAREIAFVFGVSCALGALLAASRNLYLVAGVHVLVNLVVARLVPLPVDLEGEPLLPANVLAVLVLIVAFVGVTIDHRLRGKGGTETPAGLDPG